MILRGDARRLPLADSSVDLVCTSPPYFGLRSYTDGGQHYAGQVGAEATPAEFVDALIAVTAECVRVLKPSGSIWVNLGDSYFSGKGAPGQTTVDAKSPARTARRAGGNALDGPSFGVQRKSLVGMPWRYALRCIDDLGLILRAEVIWNKPNGLPESVTDRVRRSHEQWFHFTKESRYFSAMDEIREPYAPASLGRYEYGFEASMKARNASIEGGATAQAGLSSLGKLPGSVWTIPTAPLTVPDHLGVDHFAAFPPEFPRRIILSCSPSGVCTVCGQGRRPVSVGTAEPNARLAELTVSRAAMSGGTARSTLGRGADQASRTITGYACDCPTPDAPTRPGVVLDPFSGTGTTAMVARALGRVGIGVDLSADYCRLGQWRTNDLAQHAKVRGEDFRKPEPQLDGQIGMFGEVQSAHEARKTRRTA